MELGDLELHYPEAQDAMDGLRPAKRARSLESFAEAAEEPPPQQQQHEDDSPGLLSLPDGVLFHVLSALPASSLAALSVCCKYFRARDATSGLSLIQRIAKDSLVYRIGAKQAARWRTYNWLQRLAIEETVTKVDRGSNEARHFTFTEAPGASSVTEIRLEQPGPRVLLSDASTAEAPILRWELLLRGNNAAEFGVVPVDMQDSPKALHKCQPNPAGERATGFSSAITVGSLLPARLPVMRGSLVEVLVTPREVSFIVRNPEDGAEMVWQNNSTVARAYKGPRELRLQLPFNYTTPVKLAVTAWQRAAFDVLHTMAPEQRQRHLQAALVALKPAAPAPAAPTPIAPAPQAPHPA